MKVASFYRFLVVNWAETLRLPPAFATAYEDLLKGETMTLTTEEGTEKLLVKMAERVGRWYLEDGWPRFAEENGLSRGDFVTFKFQPTDGTWRVCAYDAKGLRKSGDRFSRGCAGSLHEASASRTGPSTKTMQFIRRMKEYSLITQLELPKSFALSLQASTGRTVKLQNERGQKWGVPLKKRANNGDIRFYISQDSWPPIAYDNSYNNGDVVMFTVIPASTPAIAMQLLDPENGTSLLTSARRGGLV
ncbi:hypothetical protein C2S51_018787 [Perilla frutescens var. frutescens]|nr:hypothetical protein C2S51_018787 [Perilla frutescens var. frutescens]